MLVLVAITGLWIGGHRSVGWNASEAADRLDEDASTDQAESAGGSVKQRQPNLVGRQVCKECHAGNFALHAEHGHASTFHAVADTDLAEKFDGKTFDAGEPYGTYHYQADQQRRLFATLPDKFGDKPFPMQYALGSGMHAQTMLTLVPSELAEIEGIEHRVTHYADGHLGLSPGHANKTPASVIEYFGESAIGEPLQRCISCHTTRGKIIKEEVVDLVPGVNCEKCHGPGSEHVRLARLQAKPPAFSVGMSTWDIESEIQLCGDCHRLPRSITDKEFRDYPNLLARFQPIGLLRSRCYLESGSSETSGQLKCTTCHNPHTTLKQSVPADHIQKCVNCHQQESTDHVACPVSPATGCIDCHMPAIELDEGLKFHDHWIRVRGGHGDTN